VGRIVRTGRKPLLQIRTATGKSIKVTPEHRLLTTEGYLEASKMTIGLHLLTAPRRGTETQRLTRRQTMTRPNRTARRGERASARMIAYQAKRDPEAKRAHMRRMHDLYPDLTRN